MPKQMLIILAVIILILVVFLLLRFLVVPLMSPRPEALGITNGKLAPCPSFPNCVSSQVDHEQHQIEPIRFSGSADDAKSKLLQILQSLDRARIETQEAGYIHVVTKSPTMAFIDDNEFYVDEKNGKIEMRAAARLGREDFGANRKRLIAIREAFEAP